MENVEIKSILKEQVAKGRKTFGREPRKSKGYARHSFLYESRT